jgi:hypothetical protein
MGLCHTPYAASGHPATARGQCLLRPRASPPAGPPLPPPRRPHPLTSKILSGARHSQRLAANAKRLPDTGRAGKDILQPQGAARLLARTTCNREEPVVPAGTSCNRKAACSTTCCQGHPANAWGPLSRCRQDPCKHAGSAVTVTFVPPPGRPASAWGLCCVSVLHGTRTLPLLGRVRIGVIPSFIMLVVIVTARLQQQHGPVSQ